MLGAAVSKRQQARNERTLQELIKTVPGNNVCADCQARNPGWASWSLGVFLCMRCAALHRKIGTHITKVKSLSMDSWSNEQVDNMKSVGNVASNRIYNPDNTRPPIPFDADEADSAMERFIRQKYQNRAAKGPARHNTGSTNSDDQPPPLPPKMGSRFGFRSASSIFPLSSKSRRQAAAAQSDFDPRARSPSPDRRNKPSKIFGTSVGSEGSEDLELKMAKLRDMGFSDEKRNMTVLKGLKGNLEKSIETLVRLGEGKGPAGTASSGPSSRSRTPLGASTGLTIDRTRERELPTPSTNPFDALDVPRTPVPPQFSQSTGSRAQPNQIMGNNPFQTTQNSNPFGLMPSQSQHSLNQSFQNMAVSSSQPLFPNHTGGFPAPQQQSQVHQLYQQSMTPPVPSIPQQYYPPVIYENPAQQPQNYNPFMQQQQQVPPINTKLQQSNPYAWSAPTSRTNNFFSSPLEQSPMQQHNAFYDGGFQQAQQPQTQQWQQSNPFLQNTQQQESQQQMPQQAYNLQSQEQPQFQQSRQEMPLMSQQTGRPNTRSILDLYNYPHLAPSPLQQQQSQSGVQNIASPTDAQQQQQQRSVSSPIASTPISGSRNPFMTSGGGGSGVQSPAGDVPGIGGMGQRAPAQSGGARHVSQESMNVDAGGWTGRHSPDAWGTISSRSVR